MIAPFILRVTLGLVLVFWGYRGIIARNPDGSRVPHGGMLGIVDVATGILLVCGFLTQFAALVAVVVLGAKLVSKMLAKSLFTDGVNYYFILFVIALSILFTGAGFFAIDLPL
jgi:uncharacterized membrane protein YphA (DoxX/SURF4 family)